MNVCNKKDYRLTGSAFFLLHPASQAVPITIILMMNNILTPVFFMPFILSLHLVKVKTDAPLPRLFPHCLFPCLLPKVCLKIPSVSRSGFLKEV